MLIQPENEPSLGALHVGLDFPQSSTLPPEPGNTDNKHQRTWDNQCPTERQQRGRGKDLNQSNAACGERERSPHVGKERALVRQVRAADGEAIWQRQHAPYDARRGSEAPVASPLTSGPENHRAIKERMNCATDVAEGGS